MEKKIKLYWKPVSWKRDDRICISVVLENAGCPQIIGQVRWNSKKLVYCSKKMKWQSACWWCCSWIWWNGEKFVCCIRKMILQSAWRWCCSWIRWNGEKLVCCSRKMMLQSAWRWCCSWMLTKKRSADWEPVLDTENFSHSICQQMTPAGWAETLGSGEIKSKRIFLFSLWREKFIKKIVMR